MKLQTAYLIIFIVGVGLFFAGKAIAQTLSDYVESSVKISICGNDIAEGGEDCDNADLDNETCQTLGYGPGTLSCDIACDFDTAACPSPTLSPSPIPSPTPSFSPTPQPTTTSSGVSSSSGDSNTSATATPSSTDNSVATNNAQGAPNTLLTGPQKILIPFLSSFDSDNDGSINITEMRRLFSFWVENWRIVSEPGFISEVSLDKANQNCDVNGDGECGIIDFSILLYYVGKQ